VKSEVTRSGKTGFRESLEAFRKRHRTSSKKITFEEISEFKETGRL
jgi:hypothetical protein